MDQGWIDEKITDLDELVSRVSNAKTNQETVSIAYLGNVVDVWEKFDEAKIFVELGTIKRHYTIHGPEDIIRLDCLLKSRTY